MESDEDLVDSNEERVLGSSVADDENVESWSLLVFFLDEWNKSLSDSRRGAAREVAEEPPDATVSACESRERISHKALELTRKSSPLFAKLRFVCKGDSKSNLSPSWTAL